METSITVNHLTKRFGSVVAVDDFSLTIEARSFLTLLGPSGCGKTTLLRCIAGLEDPDGGEIYIGDKLVFSHDRGISVPSGKRDLGLVFQNYALWPHMIDYRKKYEPTYFRTRYFRGQFLMTEKCYRPQMEICDLVVDTTGAALWATPEVAEILRMS